MIKPKITAEDLVYSRSREEIQDKLQQIFGTYEQLEKEDSREAPRTIEGDVSYKYMADIEYAATVRDLDETREFLRRAYDEIAKGYKKKAEKEAKDKSLSGRALPYQDRIIAYSERYSYKELREMCRKKGLPTSGTRKELIARLV